MKIKVSDFISKYLFEHNITTVFTVVGGGAMHLNDSFGHDGNINCIYNHHEQASSIAAEAYAKVLNKMATVCVTSGPGAINALNGVVGAYMDSIPMLVISGQTKSSLTIKHSGLKLRTLGNQEFDIVSSLNNMVKYAEMIEDATRIKYCLSKAIYIAQSGRPGPCWLDIPLDIQGSYIEEDILEEFSPSLQDCVQYQDNVESVLHKVILKLQESSRPIIYAGNGIRISGGCSDLRAFLSDIKIPVVTCWDSIDLMETNDELYVGRGGIMGDRAGNFAVQNSDLVISIGNRLNIYQVGYDIRTWARAAYSIVVDIDSEELKKPTIRVDLPICCDAKKFINMLHKKCKRKDIPSYEKWIEKCKEWKTNYPVVLKKHYEDISPVNIYVFINQLSKSLQDNVISIVANGSASVVGSQVYHIKSNQRFIMNCGLSSMGYDLPAAIGACIANDKKAVICIAGDGSIQMNIQELQTIVTNKLPIKIFIINNGGYHQIRLTQKNLFQNKLVGVGPESGDLNFPDFEKIAYAYDIPYYKIDNLYNMDTIIQKVVTIEKLYCICEVICTTTQAFEPKSATKKLPDGSLFSPPLEDLAPFLPREELRNTMVVDLIEEEIK